MTGSNRIDHIRLTSHPAPGAKHNFPINWGAASARERGPVIGTVTRPQDRNVIGTHGGSYSVYRALAVSSGALNPIRRPDLTNTHPAATIGPFPQWSDPERIVKECLEFIGLEWSDDCLSPERSTRLVSTPSLWQVRQPVYTSSVERWRRYEPWLGPFAELIE